MMHKTYCKLKGFDTFSGVGIGSSVDFGIFGEGFSDDSIGIDLDFFAGSHMRGNGIMYGKYLTGDGFFESEFQFENLELDFSWDT